MFTGIIEGTGEVKKIRAKGRSRQIEVKTSFSLSKEKIGNSIAINGCCLTITEKKKNLFSADLSPETLSCTTLKDLKVGSKVNLERALRLSDPVGGHLVQGHVDDIALMLDKKKIESETGSYLILKFRLAKKLRKYLIKKGSIAIDGVSLTINEIQANQFTVCLIPHTQKKTILQDKKIGDSVNIEVDLMAKYLENLIQQEK